MPKLQPTDKEQAYRVVRACIAGNQQLYAVNDELLSIKMRCTIKTVQNRNKNPGNFTLDELHAVAKTLKLTPLQCASIVMGKPLTSKEAKDIMLQMDLSLQDYALDMLRHLSAAQRIIKHEQSSSPLRGYKNRKENLLCKN